MNFTLDDDASQIVYSSGWGIQSPDNSALDEYFERTYHAAEQNGVSVNLTFTGSAVAIYGSTGPGHADYTVQFDDTVLPNQSAWASTTQFQQLLFQRDFSSSNVAATHFLSLKVVFTDRGDWLDVDFLTFTDGNITSGATTTAAVATVTPPYISTPTSLSSGGSSTTPSVAANASTPSSKSPTVTTILAGLFGGILGLVLIFIGIWALLRHLYYRKRSREHAFRLGAPPPNTPKSSAFSDAISGRPRAGTGTAMGMSYPGGESIASFSLHNPFGTGSRDPSASGVNVEMGGTSLSSTNLGLGRSTASGSGSGHSGSVFADPKGYIAIPSRTPPPTLPLMAPDAPLVPLRAGTPVGGGGERKVGTPVKGPGVHEFLTGSPVLWAGSKHKGDADSLRTDFLQV
ncbi:hypothetical protein FOMPIDRAFT_1026112 [Fomitopsis schrenkii]|uniref:Uncharacterized protein n=1 Tax=Fomitopsis schrenkii TaxID=2126942 RepID=S8EYX9_FOMSC|nr:hypothetical protein FOMPIDRAFT_1026112 [Fomitopsis schrenkii]